MIKTFQKSSSPETRDRFPCNLVCTIRNSGHHSLFKLIPWVHLDLFYDKVKFCDLGFSVEKVDFSKTIAHCDLKLIKLMKICEY